jgi:hypothetical protein
MDTNDTVFKVICLARDFAASTKDSFFTMLKNTGYFEKYAEVTEEVIFQALLKNPGFIEDWLSFSENKRVESGAYFFLSSSGKYVAGVINSDGSDKKKECLDGSSACAIFIKREIESVRLSRNHDKGSFS